MLGYWKKINSKCVNINPNKILKKNNYENLDNAKSKYQAMKRTKSLKRFLVTCIIYFYLQHSILGSN